MTASSSVPAHSVPVSPGADRVPRVPAIWALVPCAGIGRRAAAAATTTDGPVKPKQYWSLAGRPLVEHTLAALSRVQRLRGVLLVLAADDVDADRLRCDGPVTLAHCGGATRADSVANGLQQLLRLGADAHDWVLVHDAARCLIAAEQVDALIDACWDDSVGGLLALPLPDTLKSGAAGRVQATLPRGDKWLAQTPQMFRIGLLRQALAACDPARITDESSAVEALGLAPRLVEGSAQNFKVTYPGDFALAEAALQARQQPSGAAGAPA